MSINPCFGLIGAGQWGKKILSVAQSLKSVSIEHIISKSLNQKQDNITIHQTIDDFMNSSINSVDGVIIATPPATHIPIARPFVEKGIPLLIEKPLCLSKAEANEFLQLVNRHNAPIMVNHIHLYHPAFQHLKEVIQSLGDVLSVDIVSGNNGPFREDTSVLWDWGPHDIAISLELFKTKPTIHSCKIEGTPHKGTVSIELGFDACSSVTIVNSNVFNKKVKSVTVVCEYGTIVYDGIEAPHFFYDNNAATILSKDFLNSYSSTSSLENVLLTFGELSKKNVLYDNVKQSVDVVDVLSSIDEVYINRSMEEAASYD